MKRITDRSFVYVPSDKTDVAKTFQRVREELKAKLEEKAKEEAKDRLNKILQMRRK